MSGMVIETACKGGGGQSKAPAAVNLSFTRKVYMYRHAYDGPYRRRLSPLRWRHSRDAHYSLPVAEWTQRIRLRRILRIPFSQFGCVPPHAYSNWDGSGGTAPGSVGSDR